MERNCIDRLIILLWRWMDFGKDTDWMVTGIKDTCFRNMISFFINTFCRSAFRAISDNTEGFKLISIWFYDIAVINVNDRFDRSWFLYYLKIRSSCFGRNPFFQMSGETVNCVFLFWVFVKLVSNIRQQAALGCQHTIGDVGSKFAIGFCELSGNFIWKSYNFLF